MTRPAGKRILRIRIFLSILILLNGIAIFGFSAQTGSESQQTSHQLATSIAQTVTKDFEQKPVEKQSAIIKKIEHPLRKIAHATEFGTFGGLIFLLLLTFPGNPLPRAMIGIACSFLYGLFDEFVHQRATDGRGPQFTDVLIDTSGALFFCSLILLILLLSKRRKRKLQTKPVPLTTYQINVAATAPRLRLAVVADLHGENGNPILDRIRTIQPDFILIPGDLTDDTGLQNEQDSAYAFLTHCAAIAPTFYSLGNHEIACYHKGNPWRHPTPRYPDEAVRRRIAETGAVLLDNSRTTRGTVTLCGLTSGINGKENKPDTNALHDFEKAGGFRILLCHHPEYYLPYIQKTDIELTVCGHAHGGQWRLFGRGVYAPGQGLFPKYTAGVSDGRCVISRGLGNHTRIPRIANPPELVCIETIPTEPNEPTVRNQSNPDATI